MAPRAISPVQGDCWNTIGVSGDRSCPELNTSHSLPELPGICGGRAQPSSTGVPPRAISRIGRGGWPNRPASVCATTDPSMADDHVLLQGEAVSVLIFRLGEEWLAFRTQTVAEVTLPRPVHRIPHRSNAVLTGIVNLQGQVQLCVSLHGLLGATAALASPSRLVVLRDADRAETWAFAADEVVGVRRVPRSQWRSVPSTLINPAVGFSQAVLSWDGRSVGLLDEQRVFTALRSLRP